MFSRRWIAETAERMIKTGAEALLGYLGGDIAGWWGIDWPNGAQFVTGMMLLSLLASIVTTKMGPNPQSPSAV